MPNIDGHYPLSQDAAEAKRLRSQYDGMKASFEWKQPWPESVDIANVKTVLDIAAGSCVWIAELAEHPLVRPRLRVNPDHDETLSGVEPIELYACDLTSTKFPPEQLLKDMGCHAFEQDATKPFPPAMYGKFDLIHMSLVALAFRPEQWAAVLANIKRLLKPKGTLHSVEVDLVFHPPSESLSSIVKNGHDFPACMNGNTWIHKYNSVYPRTAFQNGTYYDLSFHLPKLITDASLSITLSRSCMGIIGKYCDASPNPLRQSEATAENVDGLLEMTANVAFRKGRLEAPTGHKITTEQGIKTLREEVYRGLREEGGWVLLHEHVAVCD